MRNYSDYLSLEEEYEELSQVCARQEAEIERLTAERDTLERENKNLRAALRDCMDYFDPDNLTKQTKYAHWNSVLHGGGWNPANVAAETGGDDG